MIEVELTCDECDAEYTILFSKDIGDPTTCPFCGSAIHTNIEEE